MENLTVRPDRRPDGAAGAVSSGGVSTGAVSPGAVSPGAVSSGTVSTGAVSPGTVRARLADIVGAAVDSIVEVERAMAQLAAVRAEMIDGARRLAGAHDPMAARAANRRGATAVPDRSFRAEIATALRIPERTAETLIATSAALVSTLPHTLQALAAGSINYTAAHRIADSAVSLTDAETRAAFDRAAVGIATETTTAILGRKLRALRDRLHPEQMPQRHERALADREVCVGAEHDGMGWLNAYLPMVELIAIDGRLTDAARALHDPADGRTIAQLRADILLDVLLTDAEPAEAVPAGSAAVGSAAAGSGSAGPAAAGSEAVGSEAVGSAAVGSGTAGSETAGSGSAAGTYRGIRPRVFITVPALTLLGIDSEPATLEGYGPIDSDTARELTACAPSFSRILTHPETGAVLSVGRTRYAVPTDLRDWLRIRDYSCRFPGCNRGAVRCDIDHTVDWDYGGGTDHDNLAHLCRKHHTLKHHSAWRVSHAGRGTLAWTSPAGRMHITRPENVLSAGPPTALSRAPSPAGRPPGDPPPF